MSYERKKIDFSKATNLNAIYDDLLQAVYEGRWTGHSHAAIRNLPEDKFIRILEEIAIAAWHGEGRTTTVREVQDHCEQSGLRSLLDTFEKEVSQGLSRLFLAFYFRQSGYRSSGGDKTFEFTHKSFSEYLTARRIVGCVKRLHSELQRRKEDIDSGIDEQEALRRWAQICGPTRMDNYLLRFIRDEIQFQSQLQEPILSWQQTLSELFGYMLRYGMPMQQLNLKSYQEEARQARNAEEALLVLINSCARVTEQLICIDFPSPTAFGEWIKQIQGQRELPDGDNVVANVVALDCLSFLDLQGCILNMGDFYRANLLKTNLKAVQLIYIILCEACLEGAHLEGAYLLGANLEGANLEGANLQWANLEGANLEGANLERAYLLGANLQGAHLQWANLLGANIERANLENIKAKGVTWIDGKRYEEEQLKALILAHSQNPQET